jgi:hypothetical protein
MEVMTFGAGAGGHATLEAARQLPALLRRKRVQATEIAPDLVTGSWRRLVYRTPEHAQAEAGVIDHRAYAFCVLEQLHRGLRRRDLFVEGSDRWGDPRARLLDGAVWERAKPEALAALGLTEQPAAHLAELASALDTAYRTIAAQLPEHPA